MSTADTTVRVAWRRRHDDTLELLLANTALQVPARLGTLLLHPDRRSITNDPAADLLRAEQDLRWQAVQLGHEFDHANHDLGEHTREEQDMAARADVGGDVWRLRGEVRRRVADATATAFLRLALVDATRDDLTVLRQFVCEADVPDGPLADAAAGWRRSARRPQGVLEYASEADFVAADPRRALPGSGNRRADGRSSESAGAATATTTTHWPISCPCRAAGRSVTWPPRPKSTRAGGELAARMCLAAGRRSGPARCPCVAGEGRSSDVAAEFAHLGRDPGAVQCAGSAAMSCPRPHSHTPPDTGVQDQTAPCPDAIHQRPQLTRAAENGVGGGSSRLSSHHLLRKVRFMSRLARRPWLVLTVVALVGGALVGGVSYWGSGPGTPPAAAAQAAAPITAADYGLVTLVVHPPTGPARTWRVLRADTTPLIEHGLMGQPDLGGHHGMLFEFATPGMLSFWMKDTPLPLTIAFFSADGAMQQPTIDMAPCVNSTDCPRYNAPAPYLYALEVPQHHLAALGLVPGSRITVPAP